MRAPSGPCKKRILRTPNDGGDDKPLTKRQIRILDRRIRDLDDPVRYMIVSAIGPRFVLYYNVSTNLYAMNDPDGGTVFKQRPTAEAIRSLLGRGNVIVKCMVTRGHLKVPDSVGRKAHRRAKFRKARQTEHADDR